jgi:hypothetical protein
MPTLTLLTLPIKIFYHILETENIDWNDISQMALTCKTIKERLLDSHIGVLELNKRSHIRSKQHLKCLYRRGLFYIPSNLYTILPSSYAILDYYKGCNLLPLFESAVRKLDSIGVGMKEMIIPAAIHMAEYKENENKSDEANLLLSWAEKEFPGTTYHDGVLNMPSSTAHRISMAFSSQPIDWGPGWKDIEPVSDWYYRRRGMIIIN